MLTLCNAPQQSSQRPVASNAAVSHMAVLRRLIADCGVLNLLADEDDFGVDLAFAADCCGTGVDKIAPNIPA